MRLPIFYASLCLIMPGTPFELFGCCSINALPRPPRARSTTPCVLIFSCRSIGACKVPILTLFQLGTTLGTAFQ